MLADGHILIEGMPVNAKLQPRLWLKALMGIFIEYNSVIYFLQTW